MPNYKHSRPVTAAGAVLVSIILPFVFLVVAFGLILKDLWVSIRDTFVAGYEALFYDAYPRLWKALDWSVFEPTRLACVWLRYYPALRFGTYFWLVRKELAFTAMELSSWVPFNKNRHMRSAYWVKIALQDLWAALKGGNR